MNAWLKAPSAKKRLNKFGIFKITTKISCKYDAPSKPVVATSLMSPKTLEILVQPLTFLIELSMLEVFLFSLFKWVFYCLSKSKATELIQYLSPVGSGPSSKTCPR